MGYRTGNVCYPTAEAAADAYFSSAPPFLFESMSHVYLISYEKVNGKWSWGVFDSGTLTKSYNTLANPTFISCDETVQVTDGIALGWLVGGSMLLAFLWVKIREQLK